MGCGVLQNDTWRQSTVYTAACRMNDSATLYSCRYISCSRDGAQSISEEQHSSSCLLDSSVWLGVFPNLTSRALKREERNIICVVICCRLPIHFCKLNRTPDRKSVKRKGVCQNITERPTWNEIIGSWSVLEVWRSGVTLQNCEGAGSFSKWFRQKLLPLSYHASEVNIPSRQEPRKQRCTPAAACVRGTKLLLCLIVVGTYVSHNWAEM